MITDATRMPSLVIRGLGAVSAAGWSVDEMVSAVSERRSIPATAVPRADGLRDWDVTAKLVPPAPPALLPKHPRLRRASPVTRFMVAAAQEALKGVEFDPQRLGILVVMTNACVQFTSRFYNEVIHTPALASPLLFPETVFNAPASHLATLVGASGPVSTLIGESNLIAEALRLAGLWLENGQVDHCLVIGAEEADALALEAMTYYHKRLVGGEGAGALLLSLEGDGPRIEAVHGPFSYATRAQRRSALQQMAAQTTAAAMLVDRAVGIERLDRDERQALAALPFHTVHHPLEILGECMGAASALQLVLAASLPQHCTVSLPGTGSAAFAVEVAAGGQ
jgi:3-oxoacyl-(acyl-carrier-protein) synthase